MLNLESSDYRAPSKPDNIDLLDRLDRCFIIVERKDIDQSIAVVLPLGQRCCPSPRDLAVGPVDMGVPRTVISRRAR